MKELRKDELQVKIYPTRGEMGRAAAKDAGEYIRKQLKTQETLNIIFAAAPSQNEFLDALKEDGEIEWNRIHAFHMDEYVGVPVGSEASFSGFLKNAIFDRVPFGSVNCIRGDNPDRQAECARYAKLLEENPVDIVFMGIGENGHIAFNDPGAADFGDSALVKVVELDDKCRQQQVNDGCFPSFDAVPSHAFTVTIPGLVSAKKLFCMVPGERKAAAVRETLNGSIDEHCPASILRRKQGACLYLDGDSAKEITE